MNKLGIIGAMTVEVDIIKENLTDMHSTERAGIVFCEGMLMGLPVVVAQCGVGKVNAAMCVQIMCDCFGVTHIVNTGVAGSLSNALDIGDFVVSQNAIYHDFTCQAINPAYIVGQVPGLPVRFFEADETLRSAAFAAAEKIYPGHTRIGTVASGDQFVSDKTVKNQIVENTGALCTEMEGASIAHTAWRNGVPFVIIRAISDKADDSAQMDYPTFEAMAAKRCAAVTQLLAETL